MKTSIIIRTKNEEQCLGIVLERLATQSEKDFEVIIIDSGSTDKTLSIVDRYKDKLSLRVFKIKPEEFTYPFACNYGAEKASGKYFVYISGHSIPLDNEWLKNGLASFYDDKIAGVYGNVYPSFTATIWEKLFYSPARLLRPRKRIINKVGMGVLGNTNAIIRRDLWEQYHYDEENFADGGEDGDWAKHFLKKGYYLVSDPKFSVYHSHGFGLVRFIKQYLHWRDLAKRF